jgi:PEP-CTERM motif
MKNILATITIAAGMAYSACAQGLVSFNNSSAALSKVSTNSVVGGAATGLAAINTGGADTGDFYYALFSSVAATTVGGSSAAIVGKTGSTYAFNDANWAFDGLATNGTTRAGQVSGSGSLILPTGGVGGIAGGATGQFVVVGWSANIGGTVSALQTFLQNPTGLGNFFVGESVVTGTLTAGNGAGVTTPTIMGAASPFALGFTLGLVPVPEPTTIALATLGAASLLLFRRRNKA